MNAQQLFEQEYMATLCDFDAPGSAQSGIKEQHRRQCMVLVRDLPAPKAIKLCLELREAQNEPLRESQVAMFSATAQRFGLTLPFALDGA